MKKNIFLTESQIKVIKEWGRKKTEPITYSMDDKIELVDDPNIKDGGNFAIKRNGKQYWVSRSNTVTVYVFGYDNNNNLNILISKRGPKAGGGIGKWNVIAGFLDYGYSLEDTAVIECWEETGVRINKEELINLGTNSSNVNREVNTKFMVILKDNIENHQTSIENSEVGEVSIATWVPVNEIKKYNFWSKQQIENIIEYSNRINRKNNINTNKQYIDFINSLNGLLNDKIIDKQEYSKIINIVKR